METVAVPKMMVYVFDLLLLCYVIKGIYWFINHCRENKQKTLQMAEYRMAACHVEGTDKTFAELFEEISTWDKVRLFMYYEKLLNKEQRRRKKFLRKEEQKMRESK
jgi:hypothetical protein